MTRDPQELHKATDVLNEVLEQAEKSLCDLNLGVEAKVPFEKSQDGKLRELTFSKNGQEFALSVVISDDQGVQVYRLRNTSRHTRIESVALLEKLKESLFVAYDIEFQRVKSAIVGARLFIKSNQPPDEKVL